MTGTMKIFLMTVLISSSLVVGCSSQGDPHPSEKIGDDSAAIDALFTSWDVPGSPGCGLAVAQDGALIYTRGYGYANLDYDIPITPKTVFDVASVTKQFVAANLSMLALEGKLTLDDDIRKWLPELPEYEWPVTLRHMLHHTSGLRDYLNLFPLAGRGDYYPISHAQILDMMSRQRALVSQPGDRYNYSNSAYMLLAQVIKRASGKSLGEISQERIFDPLGMTGSLMYNNSEEIIPERSIGYDNDSEGRLRIVHNYNFDVAGDGQLYSTMEDLLRWDNYLHGVVKPAIHPLMLTEGYLNNGEALGYAQGIKLNEYRGHRTVGHSGSSWGFRTQLVRFVESGLSIAISCNSDSARPGELVLHVADHYLADQLGPKSSKEKSSNRGQKTDTQPEQPSMSRAELIVFAGNYFSAELDAIYRFSITDRGLGVHIEQEPLLHVTPIADDKFEINFYDQGWSGPQTASLDFERNSSGGVIGFNLSSGTERNILFEKH